MRKKGVYIEGIHCALCVFLVSFVVKKMKHKGHKEDTKGTMDYRVNGSITSIVK